MTKAKERVRVRQYADGTTHAVRLSDGLASVMTGSGTTADKRVHMHWQHRAMDQWSVALAFASSWLMRKIVNIPAFDMTRAWRDWQAEDDQIELIEAEEKRLQAKAKIRRGLVLGRLGGGVIIMGVRGGPGDAPDKPLPDNLPRECLRYLHPLSRYKVRLGPLVTDPNSDDFGEPEYFILRGKGQGKEAHVHRSRCIVFKGQFAGEGGVGTMRTSEDEYWGDSIVQVVNDAVTNATIAQDEIANLISEAKIDVFGIPELLSQMGNPEAERRIMRRLELANIGKSNHRALVRDAAETWEQRQIVWAGMSDIIRTYLSIVAGAADIPATRLLGKAPDGMNATGEGDEGNYLTMIQSLQESDLEPALDKLDRALLPSALGTVPPEVYYEFAPLKVLDEKEETEIESKVATVTKTLVDTGLIPDGALAQAVANRLIESGRWPGLEAALADLGEKWWETLAEPEESDLPEPGPGGGAPRPSPTPTPAPAPAG